MNGILVFLANLLWFLLGGIWLGLEFVLAGLLCCLTIVGIPFGLCCFRIAAFAFWPFGKDVVPDDQAGAISFIGNVIWFLLAGVWIAINAVIAGVAFCLTIIGIPFGIACFRIAKVALCPLGKNIVPLK